ncbi:unnamed protein product [Candida verbasci]|uniref:Cytochrome b5 heme-binding domain-containing protein n=1 Tax=Candida verbasci TaxID=1227364 RepID=A0A9W4TYC2_9ASCO|nr:unnamed protein product [Candida verbasci]
MNRFTFFDALRIFGGILLLNCLCSYWFTSSTTWNYDGKYLNIKYFMNLFQSRINLTMEELSKYNGSNSKLPIYLAINGSVFDVSSSPEIYGPGKSYNKLTGKDCARIFVTGCFMKPDEYTYDLRGLDEKEVEADLPAWIEYFQQHRKYWYVGTVQHDDSSLPRYPPSPCEHLKFPGMNVH